eukprot:1783038-Prymnesium_polylepis.1
MRNSERNVEGSNWLALLLEAPRIALQGEIRAGDQFEAGWLVVKVKWYSYHPEGNTRSRLLLRAYKLLPDEKKIVVNPLLRIGGRGGYFPPLIRHSL